MSEANSQNGKNFDGLRNQLMRSLADGGNDNVSKLSAEFSALQHNFERVDFVNNLLKTHNIEAEFRKDKKSDETANKLREQGNEMFKVKKLKEAWEFYTKSASHAEENSVNLGLAYANRSAVLFELNLHKQCLMDITRALRCNLPEHIQSKLVVREKNSKNLEIEAFQNPYEEKPTLQNDNLKIQSASNCVEIQEDEDFGRYVVASRDIKVGEVLAVEKPFVSLLVDQFLNHCHHCISLCYNLIPCKTCTHSLYCSENCRDEAFDKYHKYECPILATIKFLQDEYSQLDQLTSTTDDKYCSDRYKEIHSLVTNTSKRSIPDLFERATVAATVFNLVKKHTNFFTDENSERIFKDLYLLHLQTGPSNFHEITELTPNGEGSYELEEIASGAFSFLSLLNHSCCPNVTRFCYGTTIVLRALQNIKKGEQCFDNYGYHFAMMSKLDRQKHLKSQYYFDCACQACQDNWPLYDALPSIDNKASIDDATMAKLFIGDLDTAQNCLDELLKKLQALQQFQPCQNFCLVQEAVKQCFAIFGSKRRLL